MTEQVIETIEIEDDAAQAVELNETEIEAVGGGYGNLRAF